MHCNTLAVLGAALALAGCKESPAPVQTRANPPAAPGTPAVAKAPPLDAGQLPQPLALALTDNDKGSVNHLARAKMLRQEGDAVEALAEARRALFNATEDEEVLALVARLAQALGQRALAAAAFEKLGAVREDDGVPLVQAARLQLSLKDTEAAQRLAEEAMQRDDGNVEVYQVLGRVALARGDIARAIEWLEEARVLAPEHGWVLNNLGFAYLRANQNADAMETLRRAAELLPLAPVVHNNLGVALERMGRTEEAAAAFERSATLAPRYTQALVNRARLALLRASDAGTDAAPDADDSDEAPAQP
jgi:tetratricopeptide (TPR) repeat protein